MLSLTRSVALRVPLLAFKSAAPIRLQRSPFLSSLSTYRALSTSSPLFFAAAGAATKSSTSKTAGRTKAKSKTKAKAKVLKTKAKAKPKTKAKAKPKRKVAAKPASTRVPLIQRPPIRPPPPFMLFYSRTYLSPSTKPGGILSASKEAGEAWHKLSENDKQVYRDEAKILSARYVTQRDKWYKNPKNLQVLKTLNKDRKKRGKHRIRAPPNTVLKRPLPSFMRFAQELRETNKLSPNDAPEGTQFPQVWIARESGARWNALPASEKEKYSKAYQADLVKWRAANATATA